MSKTIIVTGASRGIGHEIVKIAEKKGHRVYSISRNIHHIMLYLTRIVEYAKDEP